MFTRRKFLSGTAFGSFGLFFGGLLNPSCTNAQSKKNILPTIISPPLVISTWNHGIKANEAAWQSLKNGGKAIDMVEQGVRVTEADPMSSSVGYGGMPDRDGNVTLDACIMDSTGNCGSVCYLKNIKHPISVARKVMDDSPHVMLAGNGALQFALENGFVKEDLLTENARKAWEKWKEKSEYKPVINVENHDTIGMLAIDGNGDIAGACTTSGLAFKINGRVGDSPIIGAGLYVDNEVGGAVATGLGESIIKSVGSFLIVEFMRQGKSPQEACEEAIKRIMDKQENYQDFQAAYIAINKKGEVGSCSIHPGFDFALHLEDSNKLYKAESVTSK